MIKTSVLKVLLLSIANIEIDINWRLKFDFYRFSLWIIANAREFQKINRET